MDCDVEYKPTLQRLREQAHRMLLDMDKLKSIIAGKEAAKEGIRRGKS